MRYVSAAVGSKGITGKAWSFNLNTAIRFCNESPNCKVITDFWCNGDTYNLWDGEIEHMPPETNHCSWVIIIHFLFLIQHN